MATATQNSEKLDFDKVWLMFQETNKQFKETRNILDKRSQETNKQFKETDKKLRKLEELFTGQWGKLMESLVEGDLVRLLNEKGVHVNQTGTRIHKFHVDREYEFDIIAENGDEIVVVEVKTTLKPDDVTEFIEELKNFKNVMPKYSDNKVYGAVAYLIDHGDARKMAAKKGLFVIRATGSSASIINAIDFKPRLW